MKNLNNNRNPSLKILMLGTGFDIQGGITSVQKLIIEAHVGKVARCKNGEPRHLKIQHVPTIVRGSALQNVMIYVKSIQHLCWKILRQEVDIIHVHFAERGSTLRKSILIAIGLLFRKSIVLHAHGATYQEFYDRLPKILQATIAFLFGQCSHTIVLSHSWRDYYISKLHLNPDRVTVLYNPVSVPPAIPDRSGRKRLKFVFLGRIGKRGGPLDLAKSLISFPKQDKGAFDLIEAFAQLPAADLQHVELILAGNGDLESAQRLIAKFNLTANISVLEWLDPQQRDELLATADAFVLPSYNEGLPMSMLEAMAWGLPAIVTPVGGIPEVVRHNRNGLLVEPGNQPQLIQAMQQLINNEALRLSLGRAARHSVEHLDINNYINSLANLYATVTSKSQDLDRSMPSNEII
ncbi:glycosyltransferase family 4 protein [Chamaesiphon sp. GL140_3_metabinner_50]|uniref:glycosyltransferase family 4 protein n=1 Tax=Chamaesiphon sp. GL140_3_metabinner_50 TaxID=2970812 RepID=UPI0025DFDD75|nr:glycosyltransferase family 4 protein [Chamaesiphon sp. GL140_3_metabinner_50]